MSTERIKSWPTKERPRERLLTEGPERLTDADLLAIILRIGSGTFREYTSVLKRSNRHLFYSLKVIFSFYLYSSNEKNPNA
jgi:DNA repair protein RadC